MFKFEAEDFMKPDGSPMSPSQSALQANIMLLEWLKLNAPQPLAKTQEMVAQDHIDGQWTEEESW